MRLRIEENDALIEKNTKSIKEDFDNETLCGYSCNEMLIFTREQFDEFMDEVIDGCQ